MTEAITPIESAEPWHQEIFYIEHTFLLGTRTDYDERGMVVPRRLDWYTANHSLALHPSVAHMVENYRPADYKKLALEWAHVSTTDELRISYTRTAADGEAGRKLVTSIGKYLARHWPHVSDHERRDAQALYTVDERVIVHTVPEFIYTVENGPRSCMASVHGSILWNFNDNKLAEAWRTAGGYEPDWLRHPYSSYRPEHGFSMAQRWAAQPDKTRRLDGRALIYTGPLADVPVFVRTYARHKTEPLSGWSETDFALHTWLEAQGMRKVDQWPDGVVLQTPVAEERYRDDAPYVHSIRAPYVDGSNRTLEILPPVEGKHRTSAFYGHRSSNPDGSPIRLARCDCTSAVAGTWVQGERQSGDDDDDDDDNTFSCEDCGETYDNDDRTTVGRNDDRDVCTSCCDHNYYYVRGESRHSAFREYYAHDDSSAYVSSGDFHIDCDYPPDGVVQLEDGDWALESECCYINGEYYFTDDGDVTQLESGEYILTEDACEIDGKWYDIDDDAVLTLQNGDYALDYESFESDEMGGTWFATEEERDEYDEKIVAAIPVDPTAPVPELAETT